MLNGAGGSNSERGGVQSKGPAKKKKIRLAAWSDLAFQKLITPQKNCFFAGLSLFENNFWDSKNLHYAHVF